MLRLPRRPWNSPAQSLRFEGSNIREKVSLAFCIDLKRVFSRKPLRQNERTSFSIDGTSLMLHQPWVKSEGKGISELGERGEKGRSGREWGEKGRGG